jgi:hypothetical protein
MSVTYWRLKMSSSANAAPADSTATEQVHTPDEVVTLAVLYASKKPGESGPSSFSTVRIRVTRRTAAEIVNFRHDSMADMALTRGLDADGGPYSLNVGSAVAIYVEH